MKKLGFIILVVVLDILYSCCQLFAYEQGYHSGLNNYALEDIVGPGVGYLHSSKLIGIPLLIVGIIGFIGLIITAGITDARFMKKILSIVVIVGIIVSLFVCLGDFFSYSSNVSITSGLGYANNDQRASLMVSLVLSLFIQSALAGLILKTNRSTMGDSPDPDEPITFIRQG
ncbi:MAG: hypothetical protein ACHQTE_02745 [Candidatus Saccharimonadales bacterium]